MPGFGVMIATRSTTSLEDIAFSIFDRSYDSDLRPRLERDVATLEDNKTGDLKLTRYCKLPN